MTLKTSLRATIAYDLVGSPDLGSTRSQFSGHADTLLADGTGTDQADRIFADKRTLNASASEDIDLAGGGLTDPHGAALTFAKVKAICVRTSKSNTNNVVVGGAASNAFQGPFGNANDVVAIQPGGAFMITAPKAGWTVTAGTGDLLKIANSGGGSSVEYEIEIVGTSA